MIAVRPYSEVAADLREWDDAQDDAEFPDQVTVHREAADLIEALAVERDAAQAVIAAVRAALDQYADDVTAGVTYGAAAIDAMSAVAEVVGR